jgi:hypothetical protein
VTEAGRDGLNELITAQEAANVAIIENMLGAR